ncbi:hypothetical protein R1sor_013837 [Riccia sorocarpa]|uniref:Uncharacterized protein n=1 Tax=Riccia sorocarpa TaxID=122646 RepID=A0ABD3H7Q5_9MARC
MRTGANYSISTPLMNPLGRLEKAPDFDHGGIGILSFAKRAGALQMRYLTAILDGKVPEWAVMVKRMIRIKLITGPNKVERKQWEGESALLMLKAFHIPEAPTVDRLLKVWFRFKKKLHLHDPVVWLPDHFPVARLKWIWELCGRTNMEGIIQVERLARKHHVIQLQDACNADGFVDILQFIDEEQSNEAIREVGQWLALIQVITCSLQQIQGWYWEGGHEVGVQWHQPNSGWTRLQWRDGPSFECLNCAWNLESTNEE